MIHTFSPRRQNVAGLLSITLPERSRQVKPQAKPNAITDL
jgi:hypothetical protein